MQKWREGLLRDLCGAVPAFCHQQNAAIIVRDKLTSSGILRIKLKAEGLAISLRFGGKKDDRRKPHQQTHSVCLVALLPAVGNMGASNCRGYGGCSAAFALGMAKSGDQHAASAGAISDYRPAFSRAQKALNRRISCLSNPGADAQDWPLFCAGFPCFWVVFPGTEPAKPILLRTEKKRYFLLFSVDKGFLIP